LENLKFTYGKSIWPCHPPKRAGSEIFYPPPSVNRPPVSVSRMTRGVSWFVAPFCGGLWRRVSKPSKILSHGKPQVFGQESSDGLRFSCSHSADLALVTLARGRELGVDLEQHRPLTDAQKLAGKFFSASEISELAALPQLLKMPGFFNGWTRKEAFLKAIGLGLSFPLDRFSVTLTPDQSAALLSVNDDHKAAEKWTMISLDVRPDYSAALVFVGKTTGIQLFNWNSQTLY